MTDPSFYFREKRLLLDYQSSRLVHGLRSCASSQRVRLTTLSSALPGAAQHVLAKRRKQLETLAAALDALSPLKVLSRGYAIARQGDGTVVASVRDVHAGDKLSLTLTDGSVDCQVL